MYNRTVSPSKESKKASLRKLNFSYDLKDTQPLTYMWARYFNLHDSWKLILARFEQLWPEEKLETLGQSVLILVSVL